MKISIVIAGSMLYAVIGGYQARAQTPGGGTAIQLIGEVTTINGQAHQITVKTEKNDLVSFSIAEKTPLRRVPPGAKDLTGAVRIGLIDIAVGDRDRGTVGLVLHGDRRAKVLEDDAARHIG